MSRFRATIRLQRFEVQHYLRRRCTTIDNKSYKNIEVTETRSIRIKNPLKKAHCVSGVTFVVLGDSLVKRLGISGDDTWFEQEAAESGILLRIHRIGSSHIEGVDGNDID